MVGAPHRPHTGRQRNEAARTAILQAALSLVRQGKRVGVSAIAQTAGVGRQTLYRWWPTPGAVVAEAMAGHAHSLARVPDTGSVHEDLATFLRDTFSGATKPTNRRMLRQIMADAQHDSYLAEAIADFTTTRRSELHTLLQRGQQRGELADNADIDILTDQAYGCLWYRLLVGHARLDHQAADALADSLIAAATPRS